MRSVLAALLLALGALLLFLLTACAPNYAGAGYVALALALDAPHAAAQERARTIEDEIGVGR